MRKRSIARLGNTLPLAAKFPIGSATEIRISCANSFFRIDGTDRWRYAVLP